MAKMGRYKVQVVILTFFNLCKTIDMFILSNEKSFYRNETYVRGLYLNRNMNYNNSSIEKNHKHESKLLCKTYCLINRKNLKVINIIFNKIEAYCFLALVENRCSKILSLFLYKIKIDTRAAQDG